MLHFQNTSHLPSKYLFPSLSPLLISHSSQLSLRTSTTSSLYSTCLAHKISVAQVSEEPTTATTTYSSADAPLEEGPVELSPSIPPIFSTFDDPTSLQTAVSVLLTGAITVFLFRPLRRRANRAKETVRQITITIRTIVNGICYLATFVFGINAVGLLLYSGQLAINSFTGESNGQDEAPLSSSNSKSGSTDGSGITCSEEDQSSESTK